MIKQMKRRGMNLKEMYIDLLRGGNKSSRDFSIEILIDTKQIFGRWEGVFMQLVICKKEIQKICILWRLSVVIPLSLDRFSAKCLKMTLIREFLMVKS